MGSAQKLPLGAAQNPDTGFVARLDRQAMGGKTITQGLDAGRIGAGGTNGIAHNGKVDALSFCRLVQLGAKGSNRPLVPHEGGTQLIGKITLALGPQCRQHGPVMRARHDGMAEHDFERAGKLLMPCMIEPTGQNPSSRRVRFCDDDVPMAICRAINRTGLFVLDHQCQIGIEAEFLPQRPCRPFELLPCHGDSGGNDEVPQRIDPTKATGIIDGIGQVTDSPPNHNGFLIVVAGQQVPHQCPSTRRNPHPCRLDQHVDYLPRSAWASWRACARSLLKPLRSPVSRRASMRLMRRRNAATARASSSFKGSGIARWPRTARRMSAETVTPCSSAARMRLVFSRAGSRNSNLLSHDRIVHFAFLPGCTGACPLPMLMPVRHHGWLPMNLPFSQCSG